MEPTQKYFSVSEKDPFEKMQLARKRYFCIFLNFNSKFFPACFEYFALTLFYWQIPGMMIMVISDNGVMIVIDDDGGDDDTLTILWRPSVPR